ncbi:putative dipeptidyl-aminopeptidase B [Trichoderma evansii]
MRLPKHYAQLRDYVFNPLRLDRDNDLELDSRERLLETGNQPSKTSVVEVHKKKILARSIFGFLFVLGWVLAAVQLVFQSPPSTTYEENANSHSGKPTISVEQVFSGKWNSNETSHSERWISGPNGEDGHILRRDNTGQKPFLRVDDLSGCSQVDWHTENGCVTTLELLKSSILQVNGETIRVHEVWPSPDLQWLLIMSDFRKQWRHSSTGRYWIMDVASQIIQYLDPANEDGGSDLFYGVPDWIYEEEILQVNRAAWWSPDGRTIAFLRLNDSQVSDYSLRYFFNGKSPGLMKSPETKKFKYPMAGESIPIADLQFFNIVTNSMLSVESVDEHRERVILEILWVSENSIIMRETNREFDIERVSLINIQQYSCETIRTENITAVDGGWVEVEPPQTMVFVPSDPTNGRPHDGYLALKIHGGYRHVAYYSTLHATSPSMLTSGSWEVADTPVIDLSSNIVYFTANKKSPVERHLYEVQLDGSNLVAVGNTDEHSGYYSSSFSHQAGFFILSYAGPAIPWKKIFTTNSSYDRGVKYAETLENNQALSEMAATYSLPIVEYGSINVDGFTLQTRELRPPSFDPRKRYPVLFAPYGGPNSQLVTMQFTVGFEAYIASSLGYLVVSVDGRGTGSTGRMFRCVVRDRLGYWEAHDQIEAGKLWAQRAYVDKDRMAIWGWSYGAYLTLKTLEQDAGRTFRYGMSVAAVTDWKLYDFAYAERHLHTPQHNPSGYNQASISNMSALNQTSRFLLVHGTADDNVHFENSLLLVDQLNQANVHNYDTLYYPDSSHGLFFHNAHTIVFDRLTNWLVNAFNGEWEVIRTAKPSLIPF